MNTKEKILDAALMLVAKYGTNKTSMALIAEKSGIAKASLYHYYKSKDELLLDMYHNARKISVNLPTINFNNEPIIILKECFKNYLLLCENEKMKQIFMIIESEKFISDIAGALYKEETNEVINKNELLFKKLFSNLSANDIKTKSHIYSLYAHELVILYILNEYTLEQCLSLIDDFINSLNLRGSKNE